MIIRNVVKRIVDRFQGVTPAEAEMKYLLSQGFKVGRNFRNHSDYAIDGLFPWLITIGDNVCLSANVKILAHDTSTEYANGYTKIGTVTIGNDVYVGYGAIILCNVRIGDHVIIGAGSVVTKDIPDWSIAAGNPCKVIRKITEEDRKYYYKDRKFDEEAWSHIKELGLGGE